MSYRSIATILHSAGSTNEVLDRAIACARDWNAHLHVLCAGMDQTQPGIYYAGAEAIALRHSMALAQEEAQALEGEARSRLSREGITWDVHSVALMSGGMNAFIADHIRFFDVVTLPLPYRPTATHSDVDVFEASLFAADRPVMLFPPEGEKMGTQRNIMIGWDDGPEALAACRAALPLLQRAENVDVTIIDPAPHVPDRSDPGGRLAEYLARHGAKVEINVVARTQSSIAAQLIQRARERDIDLIVMGAYGHSRMREALLGGATRHMLQLTKCAVLMAR